MAIRSMASATISWGMVAIPTKVYLATESQPALQFATLTNTTPPVRIRQKIWNPVADVEVNTADTLKGYEVARGQYVTFTKEELDALRPTSARTIAVQECVPEASIDPLWIEKVYYLGADKGGDRGYALFCEVLAEQELCAIAQWYDRGREHLVAIGVRGGGLVMRLLRYGGEVRNQRDVLDMMPPVRIEEPERNMARQLVAQLTRPSFDPAAYADSFAARVKQAAEAKAVGSTVTVRDVAPRATIVDLFEALKRSVDQGKAATSPSSGAAPATPAKTKRAPRAKKAARS